MSLFEGRIDSIRGQTVAFNTIIVFKHPRFKKYIFKRSKTLAHLDPNDAEKLSCEVGDMVLLQRTRPISKMKNSKIVANKTKGLSITEGEEK